MASPLITDISKYIPIKSEKSAQIGGPETAAVLVLFDERSDDYYLILTIRSTKVRLHKGEISFPGGRPETVDSNLRETALRETWEEIGVRTEDVKVLGELNPVLTRTDFVVTPYVGLIPYPYTFLVNEQEVAQVLEVPLSCLLDPLNTRHEIKMDKSGLLNRRHAYAYGQYLIFGATAWIMTQFLDAVRSVNGSLAKPEN